MALTDPTHPSAMNATDPGFDATFIGFAAHPALPATTPPPAQVAEDKMVNETFRHFCDWIHQQFSATDVFILDHEGAVVFDESRHGRLHFLARSVALAARRAGTSRGNVHVKISAAAVLEIIPVKTADCDWMLGAVLPTPLDPTSSASVLEALSKLAVS